MEEAYWIDQRDEPQWEATPDRVYFGHETCERLLPGVQWAGDLANRCRQCGIKITLVTPPVTNEGLQRAARLIDALADIQDDLEVVCSDWGLLYRLAKDRKVQPVIGRLLTGQFTDPRIMRVVSPAGDRTGDRVIRHIDGTECLLKYHKPSSDLDLHFRSSWIDRPSVIEFFIARGIRRCELSNTPQGVSVTSHAGWSYSFHVSDVLVAAMRRCPGQGEDFNNPKDCPRHCGPQEVPWRLPGLPFQFYRRDNAVLYSPVKTTYDRSASSVDRIIYRAPARARHAEPPRIDARPVS